MPRNSITTEFTQVRNQIVDFCYTGHGMKIPMSTKTLKSTIKWYGKLKINSPTYVRKICRIHFYRVQWNAQFVSFVSRAVAFSPSSAYNQIGFYRAQYEENVAKGILCYGMVSWKMPLPRDIVLRDCNLASREAYCLKRALSGREFDEPWRLHLGGNAINTAGNRILMDMELSSETNKGIFSLAVISYSSEFASVALAFQRYLRTSKKKE